MSGASDLPRVLNLGCGTKPVAGAVNVDRVAAFAPDLLHDLDCRPWPLPDDWFREVYAYDVLEHLDSVVGTMEEIHRVSRAGTTVRITVPHFSCSNAFTDPTHRHLFGCFSLHYFSGDEGFAPYTSVRFRRNVTNLMFHPTLVNRVVQRAARRWPAQYERRWAWIFPAWFLYFEVEVLKP